MNVPTLKSFVEKNKGLLPLYKEVVGGAVIVTTSQTPRGLGFDVIQGRGGFYGALLENAFAKGSSALTDMYVTARFFAEGPKVFQPSDEQAEALERVRADIPFGDYHQPFPTFAVELPKAYRVRRRFDGAEPVLVVVHHGGGFLCSGVIWSSALSTTNSFRPLSPAETIEDMMAAGFGREWDGSLPITPSEQAATDGAVRLAINACLMLTHYGSRRLGYLNPEHAERLERRAAKKTGHAHEAREELAAQPTLYGFERTVTLFRTERGEAQTGERTDRSVSPHWRVGHYRMQPHGPQNSLRKLIFVAPVLVNPHLLAGDPSNTTTYYRP
jgi:hypothetical protein